jgi:hypothetical protein
MTNCRALVDWVVYFCIISIEHCIVQAILSDLFEQSHRKLSRRDTHNFGALT